MFIFDSNGQQVISIEQITNLQTTLDGLHTAINGKANANHTHHASHITEGLFTADRLGTGTANSTKYLRGDLTWQDIQTFTQHWNLASGVLSPAVPTNIVSAREMLINNTFNNIPYLRFANSFSGYEFRFNQDVGFQLRNYLNNQIIFHANLQSFLVGNSSTTHASSIFDVVSTIRGARPFPSHSTTSRNNISVPSTAAGLGIYNTTTAQYEYWNGSEWLPFGTAAGSQKDNTQTVSNIGTYTDTVLKYYKKRASKEYVFSVNINAKNIPIGTTVYEQIITLPEVIEDIFFSTLMFRGYRVDVTKSTNNVQLQLYNYDSNIVENFTISFILTYV